MSSLNQHPDSTPCLENLAKAALAGDKAWLEDMVRALQGDVFGLALRMLSNREDAEDATQEILVRIVTRLSQFDFRSKLKTWAYRIAVNYILDVKKSPVEKLRLSLEHFAEDLTSVPGDAGPPEFEQSVLIEEVKIACTFGMLQCLDRPSRVAYILGGIWELPGPEAAEAMDISPDLFCKRLQIARAAIVGFMKQYCGLVSDTAPCRCNRMLPGAVSCGKLQPSKLDFASAPISFVDARSLVRQVEESNWALQVHRTNHPRASSIDFARRLTATLDVLSNPH